VLHDLPSGADARIHTAADGSQSQVAGAGGALYTKRSQLIQSFESVLLLVIHAFPLHFIRKFPLLLAPSNNFAHLLSILAVQGGLLFPALGFLLIFRRYQMPLNFFVPAVLKTIRHICKRR